MFDIDSLSNQLTHKHNEMSYIKSRSSGLVTSCNLDKAPISASLIRFF